MKSGVLFLSSIFLAGLPVHGQGLQPSAVALTPAIQVDTGVISQPLTLKVTAVGTLTPLASLPIQFSSDTPALVLLGGPASTDASGLASVTCIGLAPTNGHVTAMLPTGGVLRFDVTVTAPAAPHPVFVLQEIGRMAWQGTTTMDSGHSFSATLMSASGAPLAGASVEAAVLQGSVQLLDGLGAAANTLSLVTRPDGTFAFHASFPMTAANDDFSLIGVTAQRSSAVFLVHAFPSKGPPTLQTVDLSSAGILPLIDGKPSDNAVQWKLVNATGQGINGVTAELVAEADRKAACADPLLMTAYDGSFSCHAVVSGKTGSGSLSFLFGQQLVSPAIPYSISAAGVALVRTLAGNYQRGSSGQLLATPLTVELIDAFGNPVVNAPVSWQSSGANIVRADALTNNTGMAMATVELGAQPGETAITVAAAGMSAQFNVSNTSLGRLTKAAGDQQIAMTNKAFSTPLQVQFRGPSGEAMVGQVVHFAITGGSASLSAASVTTDANGCASLVVKAGTAPGFVSVQASGGGDSTTFLLQAIAPLAESVSVTDANGAPASLTPGAVMSLHFTSVSVAGHASAAFDSAPYPLEVQGLRVKMNALPAPILALKTQGAEIQLLVQVPWELAVSEAATVLVEEDGAGVFAPDLTTTAIQPMVFYNGPMRVARTVDGKFLTIKVTGIGQYAPLASTNAEGLPGQVPQQAPQLLIDGHAVKIRSIAASAELSGTGNLVLEVPGCVRSGVHSFQLAVQTKNGVIAGPLTELELR